MALGGTGLQWVALSGALERERLEWYVLRPSRGLGRGGPQGSKGPLNEACTAGGMSWRGMPGQDWCLPCRGRGHGALESAEQHPPHFLNGTTSVTGSGPSLRVPLVWVRPMGSTMGACMVGDCIGGAAGGGMWPAHPAAPSHRPSSIRRPS